MTSPEPAKVAKAGTIADPDRHESDPKKSSLHSGITQSTAVTPAFSGDSNVTPQSAGDLHTVEHPQPSLPTVGTASELKTSDIIPRSADGESFVAPNKLIIDCAKSPQSS